MLTPQALLADHNGMVGSIRALVGVPDPHWQALYRPMVEGFAGMVQQLPASEAHHHAGPGGLLRHGLEVTHETLRLRRGILLPPGSPPEEVAQLQDVWTYACVAAALLHDIGKPATDMSITFCDHRGTPTERWTPFLGPMPIGASYRVTFQPHRTHRRHERVTPLMVHHVVPDPGLRWLAAQPDVLDTWLATIQGDREQAGALGALVSKADGLSVARDLAGGPVARLPSARARPLAERLLTGLRHLLTQEGFALNRPGAAAFLDGETLWLVSKRILDTLREHLITEGQPGIPSRNDRLMDELQQHGLLVPNGDRAIWTCEIRIGEWTQRLTCLRMEARRVWPDPERRPAPLAGSVSPITGTDGAASAATPRDDASNRKPSRDEAQNTEEATSQSAGPNSASMSSATPPEGSDDKTMASETPATEVPPGHREPAGQDADLGEQFLVWLKENITTGRLEINTPRARLHVLPQGLALVSPGIFRDFDAERWTHVQKRFQKLKRHRKHPNGTNIWTCQVAKDRRRSLIKVFLIPEPAATLGVALPPPNTAVSLLTEEGADART